ncbi:hypothetical protein ACHWQZ_G006901 [Mnemiopsis leidyi]
MTFVIFLVIIQLVQGEEEPHLGRGVYLPDTPVYQISGQGTSIFRDLPSSCYSKQASTKNTARMLSFSSPDVFYRYVGVDLALQEDQIMPMNLYKTLLHVSESISTDLKVVGAGIEISREISSTSLHQNCLFSSQLNEELVRDFRLLPEKVSNPSIATSWLQYDTFLTKYGSHFTKGVHNGNKVVNFVFAKSSYKYSTEQLAAATCLKLKEGGLTFCQFPDQMYESVKSLVTSEYYEVYGGTSGTRLNMTVGEVTSEDLFRFIRSETDEEQHIRVTLEPLTSLLKKKFLGTELFSRALNLEQYYEGFLVQGCDERSVGGVLTQRFRLVSTSNSLPEYRCELAKTGCRSDDDCHLTAGSFWTHCYCFGKTCITSTTWSSAQLGTYITRGAQSSLTGSTYEGENMSCHYKFGPSCECDMSARDRWDQTWPGPRSDFLADLAMYRQLYRNGVLFKINSAGRGMSLSLGLIFVLMTRTWIL